MTEIHDTHRTVVMARLPLDAEIRAKTIVEQLGGVWRGRRLAELKAAGCFTEIIQHKTRMFVPVATAATVIDRITG